MNNVKELRGMKRQELLELLLEVTEEKLNEEIKNMAGMYKMEVEKFQELIGEYEKEQMKKDLAVQEAVTFLAENAVEK